MAVSLDDVHREQQRVKCACTRLDAHDCISARYPRPFDEEPPSYGDYDYEECSCSCHDDEDEQDEERGT